MNCISMLGRHAKIFCIVGSWKVIKIHLLYDTWKYLLYCWQLESNENTLAAIFLYDTWKILVFILETAAHFSLALPVFILATEAHSGLGLCYSSHQQPKHIS